MARETNISDVRTEYALRLLTNLENMKEGNVACDVEIIVKGESFSVHRTVLIASCKNFKRTFERHSDQAEDDSVEDNTDRKRVVQVNLDKLTVQGVRGCINYIYTGRIGLTLENIRDIFKASHFMEIEDLIMICIQYLKNNLNVRTCLLVSHLFQLYNVSSRWRSQADILVRRNFRLIIKSEEFHNMCEQEVMQYLKTMYLKHNFHWGGILEWINWKEKRQKHLPVAIESLLEGIPLSFIIKDVWTHSLVKRNVPAKSLILEKLSRLNDDDLLAILNLEICFALKKRIDEEEREEEERVRLCNILDKYLSKNFVEAGKDQRFLMLSHDNLKLILGCEDSDCQDWAGNWVALMGWVKHDDSRTSDLPDLMKIMDFKKVPAGFILRKIRNEALVQESMTCKEILDRETSFCTGPDKLVILDSGSGVLSTYDVDTGHQSEIERFDKTNFLRITSVGGELYLLENEKLKKYLTSGNWERKADLQVRPKNGSQIVSFHDSIYLVGQGKMFGFDTFRNAWIEGLDGSELGDGFCLAASDDFIYSIGLTRWLKVPEAKKYDSETGKWVKIESPNRKMYEAAAVEYHNRIYVFGGPGIRDSRNSFLYYDTEKGEWWHKTNKDTACLAAVVHKDRICTVRGSPEKPTFEVYDAESDCWETKWQMNPHVGKLSVCVCTL